MPFLNSLMLEPSDRAICGSRLAPNKTKTMTRMTSSSCEPRPNIGALLGANSANYHSTRPSGSRGGLKDDQTHTLGTEFWAHKSELSATGQLACPRPIQYQSQGEADGSGSKAREVQGSQAPRRPQVAQGRCRSGPRPGDATRGGAKAPSRGARTA